MTWTGPADRAAMAREAVTRQLEDLGVEEGGVLLVHTSFRTVGPVEGGPEGLVDSLLDALGPDGTLVMPSWREDSSELFDPERSEASGYLGILPRIFWRRPGVLRSDHPMAFAAAGPRAAEILRDPLALPPHVPASPLGRVRDADGQVLLLGVNHDANTTMHLAEILADVPYRTRHFVTVLRDGRPTRIEYGENDHCCARFRLADEWLREAGLQSEGPVGHGHARLVRSRDVVRTVVPRLEADPVLFLHPRDAGCEECEEAWASLDD